MNVVLSLGLEHDLRHEAIWLLEEDLKPAPKSVSANGCNGPELQRDTGNKILGCLVQSASSWWAMQHFPRLLLSLCPSKCGACWGALLHWGQNLRDNARQKHNTLHNCLPGTSGCSVNLTSLSFIAPSGKFRSVQQQQKPKQNCD